jgi:hypothetical protein
MVERRWETRKAFQATQNESEVLRQQITQQVQAPTSYSATWDAIAPGTKQDYSANLAAWSLLATTSKVNSSGGTITGAVDIQSSLRCDSLRIDVAPTVAAAVASTHKVAVDLNGTTYYILLSDV